MLPKVCIPLIVIIFYYPLLAQDTDKTIAIQKSKYATNTEPKKWIYNFYFSKQLSNQTKRESQADLKLKCEVFLNVTKAISNSDKNLEDSSEKLNSNSAIPGYLVENISRNIKIGWSKDSSLLLANEPRITIRNASSNGVTSSTLRIKKLSKSDAGYYSCHAVSGIKSLNSTTKLTILPFSDSNGELPDFKSLYTESTIDGTFVPATASADIVFEGRTFTNSGNDELRSTDSSGQSELVCQLYRGSACSQYLEKEFVYIPSTTTQAALETKIATAFNVVSLSKDISKNCEGYAKPSLCFSTFPICKTPNETNRLSYSSLKSPDRFQEEATDDTGSSRIDFENLPPSGLPPHLDPKKSSAVKKEIHIDTKTGSITSEDLPFNSNSDNTFDAERNISVPLRRVCKKDCVILENELCQKEYAIAKRHPHIGQQLALEECVNLPEKDDECLKIGIEMAAMSDDPCYWEKGVSYLGKVDTSREGLPCMKWSHQLTLKLTNYPELTGGHSFCRNPGGFEPQPWCFVEMGKHTVKQMCNIPRCAKKIWIYIISMFAGIGILLAAFVSCICCRQKNKNDAAAIRNINLPNADKNIYGNSRLNSPIEMSELLSNQGTLPSMGGRTPRTNGLLRVPQYSLSQIKFIEELGEGAFGKVYKGALSRGAETIYVAVKALKENAAPKTKADFRREIDLISELRHDNIVCIVGVALREEPLCMLFEFMARGDLHEFLMGRAPPSGKGLPAQRLLSISHHIACGMQYLAAHHYVHRDLAARNCLVADDFVVKISDFGLSRDIYSSDYYRVQSKSLLPIRWMPPESILYGKFTTESDIWSYGVVLWEIYSYGLQPYYGYSNQEVIATVRGGELLACPAGCPPAMFSLMRECWRHTPARRPNFDTITTRLQAWVSAGTCSSSLEAASSESSAVSSGHRPALSTGDPRERVPLLAPHYSSSNGSIATSSARKSSVTGSSSGRCPSSSRMHDDSVSVCSELPPKHKKSCGSLIESNDRGSTKDVVVRLNSTSDSQEI